MNSYIIKVFAHFGIALTFLQLGNWCYSAGISDSWTALIFALQAPLHISLFCTKLRVLNKTNVPVYYGTTNDGQHCLDCRERGWVLHTNTATELYKFKVQSPYILVNRECLLDAIEQEQARK